MNWYLAALRNYGDFTGRARRSEYWYFALFNLIFCILAIVIDNVAGTAIYGVGYGVFYILYSLIVFIPGLAVAVRRLHDVGKSGWMMLIALIPLIGAVWLIVLMATEGERQENKYGQSPKKNLSPDASMGKESSPLATNSSLGDTIVLFAVIWSLVSKLFWLAVPILLESFYMEDWFQIVSVLFEVVWALVTIGLGFAVKDKTKQMIVFIVGGVYILSIVLTWLVQYFQASGFY